MLLRMGVEICGRTDSVEVEVGCPSSFPSPDRVKPQICRYANYSRVRRFSWWTVEAIRYNLALTKASEGERNTRNMCINYSGIVPTVKHNRQNVWAGFSFPLCDVSRYATTLKVLRPQPPAPGSQSHDEELPMNAFWPSPRDSRECSFRYAPKAAKRVPEEKSKGQLRYRASIRTIRLEMMSGVSRMSTRCDINTYRPC